MCRQHPACTAAVAVAASDAGQEQQWGIVGGRSNSMWPDSNPVDAATVMSCLQSGSQARAVTFCSSRLGSQWLRLQPQPLPQQQELSLMWAAGVDRFGAQCRTSPQMGRVGGLQ